MIAITGADVVLPDRVLPKGSILIEDGRIVAVEPRAIAPEGAERVDAAGAIVAPGFIDVHVHGIEGHDTLDDADSVAEMARRLPRYGVTAFCPTSVACEPAILSRFLQAATAARASDEAIARVLPAHLESNFINPEYKGAQPAACLRAFRPRARASDDGGAADAFTGADILEVIASHRPSVGIVTIAPEIDGGLDLARDLIASGHIVSIGHSAATYEQARAAIDLGVRHATHLFNRMPPLSHRAPGLAGAVLESPGVRAELICDGWHVHPAMMGFAIRAKGADGILAITDGTAGSGLAPGSRARLGGQSIVVTERTAELDDGTLAGSVWTMDKAFRTLVERVGLSLVDAARLCATTPARQLGIADTGRIEVGCDADLVLLDERLRVQRTCIRGRWWRNPAVQPNV